MDLHIHPDRPKLLLMVLTRDMKVDKQGFVTYGGPFFCDYKYPTPRGRLALTFVVQRVLGLCNP